MPGVIRGETITAVAITEPNDRNPIIAPANASVAVPVDEVVSRTRSAMMFAMAKPPGYSGVAAGSVSGHAYWLLTLPAVK